MQEQGWDFYPVMPAPLQTWQMAAASLLFVCFIFGIVLWLRWKTENNAGTLRLNPDRNRWDSARQEYLRGSES